MNYLEKNRKYTTIIKLKTDKNLTLLFVSSNHNFHLLLANIVTFYRNSEPFSI
jgi:hypothetical protein